MGDGYLNHCKECVRARVKKHRRLNESVREYDRERAKTPERRKSAAQRQVTWRYENEAAYKAHTAVSNALRDGKISKEPCYFCGAGTVHAHHKDYARPLDVMWLCAKCHHRLHQIEEAA